MGGLEAIDPRYAALWARAQEVLGADERVRAVELAGSVASGTADRWSDLDLAVVTHDEGHDVLLADWPRWLAEITPTVFARTPIAPMIVNAVTADGLTLDLVIHRGEVFTFPPATEYVVGALSGTRFADVDAALEYAVAEQLRGLAGPFISLIARDEHVKHLAGVPHVLGLLTTVFLAERNAPPPGKLWNATYTEEQRAAVAALPPVRATRADLIAFGLGVAELLLGRARPLFAERGLAWPGDLAAVAAARVGEQLGLGDLPWLH
ncbi:MAG TPA: nucleotidyltransferase domain-containing protein [Iamia sp.]|jgi:hypothetical protein|nr:nucleotidyltransferase domain-containing protein [Iamia sp.]